MASIYSSVRLARALNIAPHPAKITAIAAVARPKIETKTRFLILYVAIPHRPVTISIAVTAIKVETASPLLSRAGLNSSTNRAPPNIYAAIAIMMPLMMSIVDSAMTKPAGPTLF